MQYLKTVVETSVDALLWLIGKVVETVVETTFWFHRQASDFYYAARTYNIETVKVCCFCS